MAGTFLTRSTQVPASPEFMLDSSLATGIYAAGAMKYVVFVPGASAIASMGWTGLPYRVLVCFQGRGTGTYTTLTDAGKQCSHQTNVVAQKLGYGGNADGSLATPDANWPLLCVFPQFTTVWTGDASLGSTPLKDRAIVIITQAVMRDVFANYNCDMSRIYLTGISAGSFAGFHYLYGRLVEPTTYTIDFAAYIPCATWIGPEILTTVPNMDPTEDYVNVTTPKVARALMKAGIPIWQFNSVNDDGGIGPASYNPVISSFISARPPSVVAVGATSTERISPPYYHSTEYTGGSAPNHNGTWNKAYGNGVLGGPMVVTDPLWKWMNDQQFIKHPNKYLQRVEPTRRWA